MCTKAYEGLDLEKILGVTKHLTKLMFIIKWKGIDDLYMVDTCYINLKYPFTVIEFYESIAWKNNTQNKN